MKSDLAAKAIGMKSPTLRIRPNVFWEFFFELLYLSPPPFSIEALLFLAEKLMLLAPAIILSFYDSSWPDIARVFSYVTVASYFSSETGFFVCSYIIFAVVQMVLCIVAWKLLSIRWNLSRGRFAAHYSALSQILHVFLVLCPKVLLQVCAILLAFLVQNLASDPQFAAHTYVKIVIPQKGFGYYLALSFLIAVCVEVLAVGCVQILFCLNRGLHKSSMWSTNSCYAEVLAIVLRVFVHCDFILNSGSNNLITLASALLWLLYMAFITRYTKWKQQWVDAAEFFFTALNLMAQVFVVLCKVAKFVTFEDHSQYVLALPIFAAMFGYIRYVLSWLLILGKPQNEEEAVEYIERLISFAQRCDLGASNNQALVLSEHLKECHSSTCDCRLITPSLWQKSLEVELVPNCRAYVSGRQRPAEYWEGRSAALLRVVVSDMRSVYGKSADFAVAAAEMQFYFFANLYAAWEQANQILALDPSIIIRQRVYNLIREISMSFYEDNSKQDPERLSESISYLKYYNSFIERVEDATELTVDFWSVLLEEKPSAQRLNELGKQLFDAKYGLSRSVQRIAEITSNHIEFLIRYGLFMRFVVHDLDSAERVFKQAFYIVKTAPLAASTLASHFSIFRGDVPVMFLIANVDSNGGATIQDFNTELERGLDYARNELLGLPLTTLMSPMAAKAHSKLVQRFFQTMDTHNIGVPKLQFFRTGAGLYVACKVLKRVVPGLLGGFQAAAFLLEDKTVYYYTHFRTDAAAKKTGIIVCDESYNTLGFSEEAPVALRSSEQFIRDILRSSKLQDLFPQLADPRCVEEAMEPAGCVISFRPSLTHIDFDHSMEGHTLESKEGLGLEAPVCLLWARLVLEEYGATEKSYILLFSPVQQEYFDRFAGLMSKEGFCMSTERLRAPRKQSKRITTIISASTLDRHLPEPSCDPELSPPNSVMSVNSVSVSSSSGPVGSGSKVSQEIRIRSMTRKMSKSIKLLYIIIVAMLIGISVLICILRVN